MKDESHGLADISTQVFWLPALEKASFQVSGLSFFFITGNSSVLYSSIYESLSFSWFFILILLLYPFWGLIQQFTMLFIISQNKASPSEGIMNRYLIIFLLSPLLSLIHFPSFFLMIFTFFRK